MLFNITLLNLLETNDDLKKSYADQGTLGYNKLIALPVIVAFIATFGAYFFYGISKTDPTYTSYFQISIAIIVICVVAVVMIQARAKKNVLGNLDDAKICLAKKIYGNSQTKVYYSIYTTGRMRHDEDFLESIADKIFEIDAEPNKQFQNKINKMFKPNLEGMNATPILLPIPFTNGEKVYKKEFSFSSLDQHMQENIQENNDKFIVLSFHSGNAVLLKSIPNH
ncbi:hypothetical protein [Chryseobacterium luteum]|uniref:Uncharacterized protein n=1 Tax=Chryseobacterium luteum TaxID=421531 RepID=A0A085ZDM0_9FLAO|nr:hypothetical protein [Chryseobacterium luteum]KFF02534.1 hypothetical protein IX38_13065 [Chryseobacterium luteum]